MNENKNELTQVELSEISDKYMMLYGVNINLQRSIPMLYDGLKPIIRRILYIMYKNYRMNKVKVSVAVGAVLTIHPHGDQGLGAVFARMAQTFSNNIPLISTAETGNSGNAVAGNDFAAPRYLDVKLSKFAVDVLFDEYDGVVNMRPSYDESSLEPFLLPAKFPIILLNGTSGIGYTLSTDIHPYNLNEIADATIKLLKNPHANVNLVPDLPTGCDIIVKDQDTFIMQSSFDVDNVNYVITIKNTPYLRFLDDIDAALCEIQDSPNPIHEIISADDESDLINNKIRYVIRCKPCNLYNVINILFKRVPGFRSTISTTNMVVVDGLKTTYYSTRQILCSWIKHRLTDKRSYLLRKLVSLGTEFNMLEGKAYMLSPENLEKTVKIFRSCNAKSEIIPSLVKAYNGNVTTSQANYVSELKMYNITNEEYKKSLKRMDDVKDDINRIRDIVDTPEKIRDVIIDELKTIKSKYGYPRRSKILNNEDGNHGNVGVVQILADGNVLFSETENPEHVSSDVTLISGDKVCLVDEKGIFNWIDTNHIEHDKPMTLTSIGKSQMGNCVFVTSNLENDIVILTDAGRIKYVPMSKVPSTNTTKKPLLPLNDNESIVSILEFLPNSDEDIFVYTNDGLGKRISISSLNKVQSVDAMGQFIMSDNKVNGMFIINPNKPLLVYVTRLGRIRVNQSKYLTTVKKFADGKSIIKLSAQDDLVAVFCADNNQQIVLNHADGRITTVNVDSLPISTMSVEPTRPKHVPGVKVVRATLSMK